MVSVPLEDKMGSASEVIPKMRKHLCCRTVVFPTGNQQMAEFVSLCSGNQLSWSWWSWAAETGSYVTNSRISGHVAHQRYWERKPRVCRWYVLVEMNLVPLSGAKDGSFTVWQEETCPTHNPCDMTLWTTNHIPPQKNQPIWVINIKFNLDNHFIAVWNVACSSIPSVFSYWLIYWLWTQPPH